MRPPCMNIDTSSVTYTLPGVGCNGIVSRCSPTSTGTGLAMSTPVRISSGTIENA